MKARGNLKGNERMWETASAGGRSECVAADRTTVAIARQKVSVCRGLRGSIGKAEGFGVARKFGERCGRGVNVSLK